MTRPDEKQAQDHASAAALEAIGNAARAYAALAPGAATASAFPPLTAVDASTALLMNPAAAFAAVAAAAAKQLVAQGHQLPLHSHANAASAAAPALVAALGAAPVVNHGHATTSNPSPAAALVASSLLPSASGASAISGAVALNQFLQSVGQQVTQAQAQAQAQAHHNLAAAAAAASAAPTPPPPASYSHSPTPTGSAAPAMAAPSGHRNAFSAVANVNAAVVSSSLLPNTQNWSLEQLGKCSWGIWGWLRCFV
jgi:pilus assembly protein FimV